jgi:hypothetical protein
MIPSSDTMTSTIIFLISILTSDTSIDYRGKFGLVQKRQLPLALHDFGGRFSDEASKGSREMCLVEIT